MSEMSFWTKLVQFLRARMVRDSRIYILPTGAGFAFLGMIVVMILAGATYNNNLIFILGFFLFAVFVVSMIQTHYNLKGLRLSFSGADPAFCGDWLVVRFVVEQKKARQKRALKVRTLSSVWTTENSEGFDLKRDENQRPIAIRVLAAHRGFFALPFVCIETQFPLGLFRSWKVFRFNSDLVVYPQPKNTHDPVPSTFGGGEQEAGLAQSALGDFGELRNYRDGESSHHVAWKQFAKSGFLFTKVHWGEEPKQYDFTWSPEGLDFESYLQTLSGWIAYAVKQDARFSFQHPEGLVPSSSGLAHAHFCWRILAGLKAPATSIRESKR